MSTVREVLQREADHAIGADRLIVLREIERAITTELQAVEMVTVGGERRGVRRALAVVKRVCEQARSGKGVAT